MTTYVLGGGCFWCLDAAYRAIKGVKYVESGYAGGVTTDPTYTQVSSGTTGHAEVVRVTFDETIIPAATILDIFFLLHNPTTKNRQGADIGPQYRSIMLATNATQAAHFQAARDRAARHWDEPLVTEIDHLATFYPAEAEHQDYFRHNPERGYCQIVINPKLAKLKATYRQWLV